MKFRKVDPEMRLFIIVAGAASLVAVESAAVAWQLWDRFPPPDTTRGWVVQVALSAVPLAMLALVVLAWAVLGRSSTTVEIIDPTSDEPTSMLEIPAHNVEFHARPATQWDADHPWHDLLPLDDDMTRVFPTPVLADRDPQKVMIAQRLIEESRARAAQPEVVSAGDGGRHAAEEPDETRADPEVDSRLGDAHEDDRPASGLPPPVSTDVAEWWLRQQERPAE